MIKSERDALRVDVPVGFLLPELREILVSVDRPSDTPLSIRLRLIPAEVTGLPGLDEPRRADDTPRPVPVARTIRRRARDPLPDYDYGGGD